jgi:hypothetical protein
MKLVDECDVSNIVISTRKYMCICWPSNKPWEYNSVFMQTKLKQMESTFYLIYDVLHWIIKQFKLEA